MTATKPPRYPECCPECLSLTGWPYAAGTCERPGIISVKLRCQSCGHEWTADGPKPTMAAVALWGKRPDRRKNAV